MYIGLSINSIYYFTQSSLLSWYQSGRVVVPVEVTGRRFPLPTIIFGGEECEGEGRVRLPASEVM
jgi:hypothetical protein